MCLIFFLKTDINSYWSYLNICVSFQIKTASVVIHETWLDHTTSRFIQLFYFRISWICRNNMANERTCEVEMTQKHIIWCPETHCNKSLANVRTSCVDVIFKKTTQRLAFDFTAISKVWMCLLRNLVKRCAVYIPVFFVWKIVQSQQLNGLWRCKTLRLCPTNLRYVRNICTLTL